MRHRARTDRDLLGWPLYLLALPFYIAANWHDLTDETRRRTEWRLNYRKQIAAHKKVRP